MISLEELQLGKILLIDKPLDWTSFDVVKNPDGISANLLESKIKVGHAGRSIPRQADC